MDPVDLAYAAGFLDGEGCFWVCPKTWKIGISCSNTDVDVVRWLHTLLGGSLRHERRKRKANHRTIHTWQAVSQDALHVCQVLTPYLHEKTRQALLLIAIQQTKFHGKYRIPPEVREERCRLNALLKQAKGRLAA